MILRLIGELSEAIVWPSIKIGNEGGLILTATHLIQQPTDRIRPERNSCITHTVVRHYSSNEKQLNNKGLTDHFTPIFLYR